MLHRIYNSDDSFTLRNQHIVLTTNTQTITLPNAKMCKGKQYIIKKKDSAESTVTINTYELQTIDGNTTYTLTAPNSSITIVSDGENWMVI